MQLMISAKMQRNTRFKPGRGSQILEQLNYDKENIEIQENSKEITKNSSIDITEGTPSPQPVQRNLINVMHKTVQSSDEEDKEEEQMEVIINVLSEDDSVADPDWQNLDDLPPERSENDSGSILQTEVVQPKKIKTTRWHKRREDSYDRNAQKRNRSQSLPYKNYKKQVKPPKAPKSGDCKCKLNCSLNFSEEDRKEICKSYWALSEYTRQKDFILMNVTAQAPQRRLVKATRKRNTSRYYYFVKDTQRVRVCEKFFKNTLCISNGPINKAFSERGTSGAFEGQDRRGKHEPVNKTKDEDVQFVKGHIEAFPTMESHYCRNTSSKKYLDSTLSISKMYELYKAKCTDASKTPVSINVYRNIFCTQYNLDFHKPKKDQCLMCHKYNRAKEENAPDLADWQNKYDKHISLKEQSRKAKELDKVRANEDDSFNSITIDLQKVLHLPTSDVSLLYYLRKLNVYNATIYEARSPNDGFCYIWSEVDGKKGSDEVGTALYLWIQRLPSTVTEISIFSDTCGGQNRNQFLLCLMLYLVQTSHLDVIEHKYLESGHTHMEVDSMHSAIENQMRLMPMYSMIDLCNVIRLARSNRKLSKIKTPKKPYEPIVMSNTDILDLKELQSQLMVNRSIDSEGQKLQWLKVKCFRFEKTRPNVVLYRYDYTSDYKELDVSFREASVVPNTKNLRKRKREVVKNDFEYNSYSLKKAYSTKLPITKSKKKDLLKMCSEKIIPAELHDWYEKLPDKEGPDFLPEEEMSSDTE